MNEHNSELFVCTSGKVQNLNLYDEFLNRSTITKYFLIIVMYVNLLKYLIIPESEKKKYKMFRIE